MIMNKKLYNNILNSIGNEVEQVINEQFNIGKMNLGNIPLKKNINIFNKNITDFIKIYNSILDETVTEEDIYLLNDYTSVIAPKDKQELREIIIFYSNKYPCESLNWLDVSEITSMSNLFNMSNAFTHDDINCDISRWDVSNVTDMRKMFYYSKFTGDISNWNVSNVTNMSAMFYKSIFNGDISRWDVSNVTNMSAMFRHSLFNSDISKWNVSHVNNMSEMFCGWDEHYNKKTEFNQNISKWDVSNVTDMSFMFAGSVFNQNISRWEMGRIQRYKYGLHVL